MDLTQDISTCSRPDGDPGRAVVLLRTTSTTRAEETQNPRARLFWAWRGLIELLLGGVDVSVCDRSVSGLLASIRGEAISITRSSN